MSQDDLTPKVIVEKLDQYIIGQQEAKRAVAIALRVLAGDVKPGAWTPSQAFGARFIETIPGCQMKIPA